MRVKIVARVKRTKEKKPYLNEGTTTEEEMQIRFLSLSLLSLKFNPPTFFLLQYRERERERDTAAEQKIFIIH